MASLELRSERYRFDRRDGQEPHNTETAAGAIIKRGEVGGLE